MKYSFANTTASILLGAFALVGASQAQSNLMRNVDPTDANKLTPNAQLELNRIKSDSRISNVASVHLDSAAFNGNIVAINTGTTVVNLVKKFSEPTPDGGVSWAGQQDAYNYGVFYIKDGKISGTVTTRNGTFQISPLQGDLHAIAKLDKQLQQPKDESTQIPAGGGQGTGNHSDSAPSGLASPSLGADSAAAAVANPPVRILVAYSAHASASLGSQLIPQINQAIAQINLANTNSSVAFRAVLAGTIQVNYTGPYTASDALAAFRLMPDVLSAHDAQQADLMVMLEAIPANAEAGISAGINVTAANAFAVVSTAYMTSNLAFAHEVGHLMGADHPQADTTQNVFRFGHGYWEWQAPVFGSAYAECAHTIMSYAVSQSNGVQPVFGNTLPQCANDPRLAYWSSPTIYAHIPVGAPVILGGSLNDNAQVLNITGPIVTNFHLTALAPTRVPPPRNPPCSVNPRLCA